MHRPKLFFFFFALSICILSLRAQDFNILAYGALKNELSTTAIQQAIDACHDNGGGRVVVPSGTFVTGTLILKSRVNLYLEQGAELLGSINVEDYSRAHRSGLIFCEDAFEVSISGKGTINGRGSIFYETDQNHVYPEFDRQLTRQKLGYMPEGEFYTDGPLKRKPRPGMTIMFWHCNQVSITGITILDTPVWALRLAYCDNALVEGVTIRNNMMIPNSDGIHATTSRNIRIANCDIEAGDDAIVITGFARIEDTPAFTSEEQDRFTYGNKSIYSENFQVSNCRLRSRSAGIRVGYGQHPIRRCVFSNIVITGSNRGIGVFAHDASDIEELIFSDITIETSLHNGQWWGNGEPIHLSAVSRFKEVPAGQIRKVQFNNITATGEHGILVYGLEESTLEDIRFTNVSLHLVKGRETMAYGGNFDLRPTAYNEKQIFAHDIPGLYAQHVNNLMLRDFTLTWGDDLPGFFTHGLECVNVKNLKLDGVNVPPNPNSPRSKKVSLTNTTRWKK
jgi:polygalacturonase